jgi:hypothetical protein
MATFAEATIEQSTREIRRWQADFTDDLPTGGSVTGGTAIHTPPSGAAATPTITSTATTVTATLGPLTATGIHYLDVQATFSNAEKSEVRIAFVVNYPTATARASMADLITALRGYTAAGFNEYAVAALPYWSDAQLQAILDRHCTIVTNEPMYPFETIEAGAVVAYYNYQAPGKYWESTSGGTARFVVQDETFDTVGTAAYSVDYNRGLVTFGTTTAGATRYVSGYCYDLAGAAAEVWNQKASHYVTAYDFSTDNHNMRRSQIIDNCLKMAREYTTGMAASMINGGGVRSVTVERSDTSGVGYED